MKKNELRKQIETVLAKYPESRDSDITLMIKIWEEFHNVYFSVQLNRLYDLPREDNIKRIRAKIQNEEKRFLPTKWEIAKKRNILREEWEGYLGYTNKNVVENYIEAKASDKRFQNKLFDVPVQRRYLNEVD